MTLLKILYSTILDALFPISPAEEAVLSLSPDEAWKQLPRAANFSTREACSLFSYKDERVWRLIWSLKYKKSARAALIAGQTIYRILDRYSHIVGPILVLPMPISGQRRRERGFNQAELITSYIQKINHPHLFVVNDLLIRARHTSRQTLKSRNERLENSDQLFSLNERVLRTLVENYGESFKNQFTIIIDDVVTTGSTMNTAVTTLRNAGFTRTFGLSVAH